MTRPHRAVAAVGFAGGAALALVHGILGPAAGAEPRQEDAAEEVTLEVAAGFGGFVAPGRAYPVMVTITAQRRVEAELQVGVLTTPEPSTIRRQVEVAAGTTERFDLLAPPGQMTGRLDVRATLLEEGQRVVRVADDLVIDLDQELVGLLPDTAARHADLPAQVPLAVATTGVAHTEPVDGRILDMGALALEPLDQLVVLGDELTRLPDDHRAAVTTWVGRGGQLLVVAADPGALGESLPAAWRPGAAGAAVPAGLGQVRLVGDDWPQRLLPSRTRSAHEEEAISDDLAPVGSLAMELADDARARLPAARGLGLLLVGYVVLVGPLAFLALRALRRRQLAWVVVPVLALGSTGVAVAGGDSLSEPSASSLVTVYETGPGGTVATSSLVMTNRSGGDVGVRLPAGWTATPLEDVNLGDISSPMETISGPSGDDVVTRPSTGGAGAVTARGPVPGMAEALTVTARSEADGRVVGTVRNHLDVALEHVVALVGRTGLATLGTLGPGEEREFEMDGVAGFRVAFEGTPELAVWPRDRTAGMWSGPVFPVPDGGIAVAPQAGPIVIGPDGGPLLPPPGGPGEEAEEGEEADDESPVLAAAWSQTLMEAGWNYRPPGQVLAVGWTDALDAPLELRDGTAPPASSDAAVVARGSVAPVGGRLTDAAVARSYVRGPMTEMVYLPAGSEATAGQAADAEAAAEAGVVRGELGGEGTTAALYAFHVPAAVGDRPVDLDRLTLGVPERFQAADIWTAGGWRSLSTDTGGGARVEVPLPPGAVVDGMVFVRAGIRIGVEGGDEFVLYEKEVAG